MNSTIKNSNSPKINRFFYNLLLRSIFFSLRKFLILSPLIILNNNSIDFCFFLTLELMYYYSYPVLKFRSTQSPLGKCTSSCSNQLILWCHQDSWTIIMMLNYQFIYALAETQFNLNFFAVFERIKKFRVGHLPHRERIGSCQQIFSF